jgi:hypothetical protein
MHLPFSNQIRNPLFTSGNEGLHGGDPQNRLAPLLAGLNINCQERTFLHHQELRQALVSYNLVFKTTSGGTS